MRILVLSSQDPEYCGGLGKAIVDALRQSGHHVSYLTRINYKDFEGNFTGVLPDCTSDYLKRKIQSSRMYPLFRFFVKGIKDLYPKSKNIPVVHYEVNDGITFMYRDERNPEVPAKDVVAKITESYDAVIVSFWQFMLNSTTLKAIYDKLKCPILIYSVDMAPMTGGCFYFGKCMNFTHGCGCCPALKSNDKDDDSHRNYTVKMQNYSSMNCAFLGNTWMNQFAEKSGLFKKIYNVGLIVDPEKFSPGYVKSHSNKTAIPKSKEFIIFLRSAAGPHKGDSDKAAAIKSFISGIEPEQRRKVLVLIAGDDSFVHYMTDIDCDYTNLGMLDIKKLINVYRSSSVFLNTPIDDAGPSMVNQSLMCGTPVISYESGVAIDVVEDGISGYKVKKGDIEGLANSLSKVFKMSENRYNSMRKSSREMAMKFNSPSAFSSNIENIIMEMTQDS